MSEMKDTLNVIATSLEGGLSFDEALNKVTETFDNDISKSVKHMMRRVKSGQKRRVAIKDMANQLDIPEMTKFVDDVIKADEDGTPILDVVKQYL